MSDQKQESIVNPKQVLKINQQFTTYQSSPTNYRGGGDIYNDEDDDNIQDVEMQEQLSRQDLYMVFINEKDLKHYETISIKASLFKGIAVRIKDLSYTIMENVLFSIQHTKDKGITNLMFDDCRFNKKSVERLINFIKGTSIVQSICLHQIIFEEPIEFKKLIEAISQNSKIIQVSLQGAKFDEDFHGKALAKCTLESKSLKELDLSYVVFTQENSFYESCSGLLIDKCKLSALKLRGISITKLESQVMELVLTKNKSLQTLDLSQCSSDSPENLESVFNKFDVNCNIKTLLAENINADINIFINEFGAALGNNVKLEGLSLKENKIKQVQYCRFWDQMSTNRSLKSINITKTEVNDKVCVNIGTYIKQQGLILKDLNISRNLISTDGLIALSVALKYNKSIIRLNLSQNYIKEGGIEELVIALNSNKILKELCLSTNKINNSGLSTLSGFLPVNSTLRVFDISKNNFNDTGFQDFAKALAFNKGIDSLNISKNKDITDEVGLKELALALATNQCLAIMDISGLKVRKPCVIQYFQPSLKYNITLKRIIGKMPPGIINEDLKENITIEGEIMKWYKILNKRQDKKQIKSLPIHKTKGDLTYLNLRDQRNDLLGPALKFIKYRQIQVVDLSNMRLEDDSLRLLAVYLEENPLLRSLAIAENNFADDGILQLILSLKKNKNLNHLNILGCQAITNQSLRSLEDMITQINMSLYCVEMDTHIFDQEIIKNIQKQTDMNRAIQENLKPLLIKVDNLTQIQFDEKAQIGKYFDSAIKTWRIMTPSIIKAVNQGLEDDHVEKLCEFLSGKNLIQYLNLRRNKIGSRGAIAIANYIRKADRTLNSLDIERNEITDEGGEALLKAMQSNMRMEKCKILYGNPLRQKIGKKIESEIKANLQIKQTILPTYIANKNRLDNYSKSDKGPEYVRCALKSCELFKVLHLSLPDNMIGEKEIEDIAFVISRNTPLRTLNLSDNIVDAKSAVLLAQALAKNSHLKEIDLRNNRLGDAGIAIILEPFILQKLQEFDLRPKIKNTDNIHAVKDMNQAKTEMTQLVEKKELITQNQEKTQKIKRFKMKVKKIILDNNGRSDEALKHIYTTLLANSEIEISIDFKDDLLKQFKKSNEDRTANIDGGESQVLLDPREANQSPLDSKTNSKQKNDIKQENVEEKSEVSIEKSLEKEYEIELVQIDQEEEDDYISKQIAPPLFRLGCCKICRKLFYPPPERPRVPAAKILLPAYFRSIDQARLFKMSLSLLQVSEKVTQIYFLYSIMSLLAALIFVSIVLPFIVSQPQNNNAKSESCSSSILLVEGAFGGIIAIQTILELFIFFKTRRIYKMHNNQSENLPTCNFYLLIKWIQGIISNADTFLHICFSASGFSCYRSGLFEYYSSNGLKSFAVILALSALIAVLQGNKIKAKLLHLYLKTQPQIHKIQPNSYRNTQLAWICGMYSTAILFESSSLSEYMIQNGEPYYAGKYKAVQGQDKVLVQSINIILINQKFYYQDLPMIVILILHYVATMSYSIFQDPNILIYLGVTLISLFSGYVSKSWERENNGVQPEEIVQIIRERQIEIEMKRMLKPQSLKIPGMQMIDQIESSQESDNSDIGSSGISNTLNELVGSPSQKNLNHKESDALLGFLSPIHGANQEFTDRFQEVRFDQNDQNQQLTLQQTLLNTVNDISPLPKLDTTFQAKDFKQRGSIRVNKL